MTQPAVSVVMSVFNGQSYLRESLQSILAQQGVHIEVILVDDGSTDESSEIARDIARSDRRLILMQQENQGLTRALIAGCSKARGKYIARHDTDDVSYPGRLKKQLELLDGDPRLTMVSCWSVGLGPNNERLFEIMRPDLKELATRELLEMRNGPPGHGSVMFRADDYHRIGGYRAQFRFAQDSDLWLRLCENGQIAYVSEELYGFRVNENSISSDRRRQQEQLVRIAYKCLLARKAKDSESVYLDMARQVSDASVAANASKHSSRINYFIGKCLLDRRDARARWYLGQSVRSNPWQIRAWCALFKESCVASTESNNSTQSVIEPHEVTRVGDPEGARTN